MTADDVKTALSQLADAERAAGSAWFFKTGPGQYGEGDEFLGVKVPDQRRVAQRFKDLPLGGVSELMRSPVHEHRLTAALILVNRFEQTADETARQDIYQLYLKLLADGHINNWDIVDTSAPAIVGGYLSDKNRQVLIDLARSGRLWHQRTAVLATFFFIKQDDFTDCLLIAELLLDHSHDLIHKAVGWSLREIGNRDRAVEEAFLQRHYKYMPRTMLRYAIEKFPEDLRQSYLAGRV